MGLLSYYYIMLNAARWKDVLKVDIRNSWEQIKP